MDLPFVAHLLGDARLARIQQGKRRLDRLADCALGVDADIGPVLPGGIYGLGKLIAGHRDTLAGDESRGVSNPASACHPRGVTRSAGQRAFSTCPRSSP